MAKTYVYNCSSRPEVNELLGIQHSHYGNPENIYLLKAKCPNFILTSDWTDKNTNTLNGKHLLSLLGIFPTTITDQNYPLSIRLLGLYTSEEISEEEKIELPPQLLMGSLGTIITTNPNDCYIDLQNGDLFVFLNTNSSATINPGSGGLINPGGGGSAV